MSNVFRKPHLILFLIMICGISTAPAAESVLSPGDIIRVTVFGHTDLSSIGRVSEDGMMTMPLLGDVMVGGLTSTAAEAKIAKLYQTGGFVRDAQVSIFVEQRQHTLANSVLILGHVAKPGKYPIEGVAVEGVQTLVDLLAMAGGTAPDAADHLLLIRRSGSNVNQTRIDLTTLLNNGELQQNAGLVGGDIIFVPENDVFYIFGQVQKPGRYRLERNMSVMQAISVGGGIGPRGSEKGVSIRRNDNGKYKIIDADFNDELRPGDVVYVKESLF